MTDNIPRTEYDQFVKTYESRHAEMLLTVASLHAEIKEMKTEVRGDNIQLIGKMDLVALQMAKRGMDAWKFLAASSFSLIAGYIINNLQHYLVK